MRKRVKVADDGDREVGRFCRECGTDYIMTGFSDDQAVRLLKRYETKEHIQDIIPNVPAEWRELFVGGMCPKCWNKKIVGEC